MEDFGLFDVTTGLLLITDPCELGQDDNVNQTIVVSKGKWRGTVTKGIDQKRIASLLVTKSDLIVSEELTVVEHGYVKVRTGQLGIFDLSSYRDDSILPPLAKIFNESGEIFYNHCCISTLSKKRSGLFPFGIVSSTGYGDGFYEVQLLLDKGETVGIKVIFIPEAPDLLTDTFMESGVIIDVVEEDEKFIDFFNDIFGEFEEDSESEDEEYLDFDFGNEDEDES